MAGTLHRIGDDGTEIVAEGLDQPEGLAAANGSIYVVEAGSGLVTAINPATGESATVAGPLELHVPPVGSLPEHDVVQRHCHRWRDSLGRGRRGEHRLRFRLGLGACAVEISPPIRAEDGA